jgi:hypothetical protein
MQSIAIFVAVLFGGLVLCTCMPADRPAAECKLRPRGTPGCEKGDGVVPLGCLYSYEPTQDGAVACYCAKPHLACGW